MCKLPWTLAVPAVFFGSLMANSDPRAQELQPIPRPAPENDFRLEKSRMVPMRDGVRLATDLYFPDVEDEQLPVVLIRTPYDKNRMRDDADGDAHMFASHGFIVATQHGDQRADGCQSGSCRLLLAHRRWQFRENRLGQIESALQDADEGNFRGVRQVAPAQRLTGLDDRFGRRGCLDYMTETARQGFRTTRFR